jgi:hypothetical protein
LSLTTGSANTIKLTNSAGGGFDSFDAADILLYCKDVVECHQWNPQETLYILQLVILYYAQVVLLLQCLSRKCE